MDTFGHQKGKKVPFISDVIRWVIVIVFMMAVLYAIQWLQAQQQQKMCWAWYGNDDGLDDCTLHIAHQTSFLSQMFIQMAKLTKKWAYRNVLTHKIINLSMYGTLIFVQWLCVSSENRVIWIDLVSEEHP